VLPNRFARHAVAGTLRLAHAPQNPQHVELRRGQLEGFEQRLKRPAQMIRRANNVQNYFLFLAVKRMLFVKFAKQFATHAQYDKCCNDKKKEGLFAFAKRIIIPRP
jgi:hypothetical protein